MEKWGTWPGMGAPLQSRQLLEGFDVILLPWVEDSLFWEWLGSRWCCHEGLLEVLRRVAISTKITSQFLPMMVKSGHQALTTRELVSP